MKSHVIFVKDKLRSQLERDLVSYSSQITVKSHVIFVKDKLRRKLELEQAAVTWSHIQVKSLTRIDNSGINGGESLLS